MNTRLEPGRVYENSEVPGSVHQVQVGRIANPAVLAGEGQLQVEVNLEVTVDIFTVEVYRFNLVSGLKENFFSTSLTEE